MPSITKQYSTAARQARSVVERTTDVWTQGARTLTDVLPAVPQVDLVPAVERYFDLVQRTVELNRSLAVRCARAANSLSGVVHDRSESVGPDLRGRAESAGEAVREKAAAVEQAGRVQAKKVEQVQQEFTREAHRIEREQARRVHARARARYEGLTRAELSDLLAQRGLPKSGNVDQLVDRLADADTK
jgi:SAP domain